MENFSNDNFKTQVKLGEDNDNEARFHPLVKGVLSFDARHRIIQKYHQDSATNNNEHSASHWSCVSPMTNHVIRKPIRMRRSRSRSFSHYLDIQSQARESHMLLPPKSRSDIIPNYVKENNDLNSPSIIATCTTSAANKHEKTQEGEKEEGQSPGIIIMYGLINAAIVVPVVMSFGSIIYRHEAFGPYLPILIRLTLCSAVVHQLSFSAFSSLPFAVGAVQDAGLIFLSSMASDMAVFCQKRGYDDDVMLATVTVGLSLATAILGVALICIGKLGLAKYVQMLPTCVVSGYLAFIGWFCGISGVLIMAQSSELNLDILDRNLILVMPGVIGGLFIYASVRTFQHIAVLPTCIVILLLIFYIGLGITGNSLDDATRYGWIQEADPPPVWYHTWDFLKLNKVVWSSLPPLLLTELSMIGVVALSSSLDVAAIELELNKPLDYNSEICMVGLSNTISGVTGGYTGSYIFSQSIFNLRSGIRTRLVGVSLAIFEIVVIVTPFPILSYVPNFFYGSLLIMICVDLLYEWLWSVRSKVTTAEYAIGLATFFFIQLIGVEYGIAAGVVLYMLCLGVGIDVGDVKITTDETESSSDG